jgi:hypothetical protein
MTLQEITLKPEPTRFWEREHSNLDFLPRNHQQSITNILSLIILKESSLKDVIMVSSFMFIVLTVPYINQVTHSSRYTLKHKAVCSHSTWPSYLILSLASKSKLVLVRAGYYKVRSHHAPGPFCKWPFPFWLLCYVVMQTKGSSPEVKQIEPHDHEFLASETSNYANLFSL